MNWWIVAYVLCGSFAWLINAGWTFAYFQSKYPTLAKSNAREDLGTALFYGAFTAVLWPATVPMIWCLSGFAKYGWRLK